RRSSRSCGSNTATPTPTPGFTATTTASSLRSATPSAITRLMPTSSRIKTNVLEDPMKVPVRLLIAAALAGLALSPALADLKVAPSLTDLASVAQYVGGKHVTAQSLCPGFTDPHFVPAKPSLMKSIQHADAFVSV